MTTALPYAVAIGMTIAALFLSYHLGYNARDKELVSEQYKASLEAMNKIQKTFSDYERLAAQIENSTDDSTVPPLIRSTIDSLPSPKHSK